MRPMLWLVFASLLFAGCASPDAVESAGADGEPGGASTADGASASGGDGSAGKGAQAPRVLLSDTLTWHSAETQDSLLWEVNRVEQPVLNPCLWAASEEGVHDSNLKLGEARAVPAGTSGFEVDLSWADIDYLGKELFIAYRGPDMEAPQESPAIPRDATAVFEVPATSEGTWTFWACLQEGRTNTIDAPETGPRYFAGDLTFELRMVGV